MPRNHRSLLTAAVAAAFTAFTAIAAAPASAAGPTPEFTLGPDGPAQLPNGIATSHIYDICPGDFNGDGDQDMAAAYRMPSGNVQQLSVAYGDGTGHLGPMTEVTGITGVGNCASGDLDDDGRDDLAYGGLTTPALAVARSTGPGFGLSMYNAAGNVGAVETGDPDGDGDLDVIVAVDRGTTEAGGVQTLRNDGTGQLVPATPSASGGLRPQQLAVADLNDDGRDDAIVSNFGDTGGTGANVSTTLGQADGGFVLQSTVGYFTESFAVADYTGDGRPDVAVPAEAGHIRLLVNQGSGNLALDPDLYPELGGDDPLTETGALAAADVNADGIADVIAGERRFGRTNTQLWVFTGTGSAAAPFFDAPTGPFVLSEDVNADVRAIGVADLDGDTYPDFSAGTAFNTGVFGTMLNTTGIPPSELSPAGIGGVAVAGRTLTCTPGSWRGRVSFTYEWLRNGNPISGETASTYVVRDQDVGSELACRVTASNSSGSAQSTSASVFGLERPAIPANAQRPRINGDADFGKTIACAAGSWTAGGGFSYRWLRDGVEIPGVFDAGYEITKADIGHQIVCRVTVANAEGSGSANSAPVRATGCVVPVVKGLKAGAAKRAIRAAGCKPGKARKKPSGGKPGLVLKSKPKAGTAAPSGTRVALVVSAKR